MLTKQIENYMMFHEEEIVPLILLEQHCRIEDFFWTGFELPFPTILKIIAHGYLHHSIDL